MTMTDREVKRLAIRAIVDSVHADMVKSAKSAKSAARRWRTHADTLEVFDDEDRVKVEKAARQILDVLSRRAARLRSVRAGRL